MPDITVRSELNAIVWKIEAAVGAAVQADENLVILESMKMEIPVAAPLARRVARHVMAAAKPAASARALMAPTMIPTRRPPAHAASAAFAPVLTAAASRMP
jgi:acetyl-CoA carboxylase biotin carboxyl carrier protein